MARLDFSRPGINNERAPNPLTVATDKLRALSQRPGTRVGSLRSAADRLIQSVAGKKFSGVGIEAQGNFSEAVAAGGLARAIKASLLNVDRRGRITSPINIKPTGGFGFRVSTPGVSRRSRRDIVAQLL